MFKRIIPEVVQTFLVPFFVLLIALPIGFLVIGPIVSMLTDLLSAGFTALMSFSPALYGLILGFFWQVLVNFWFTLERCAISYYASDTRRFKPSINGIICS